MPNYHISHISESITRELTAILRTVKDPRVADNMVSILRVDVTRDLSYATVHITSLGGMDGAKQAAKGLQNAAGYMRKQLGLALKLRHTPELRFVPDDSIAYSAHIATILNDLNRKEEEPSDE
ncbi:MAG: 30S ribosome-binding factor RbfA [Clostridia bacterium]|nr:30S ribosome-binding factor RbfA [Clostridia bacterium]